MNICSDTYFLPPDIAAGDFFIGRTQKNDPVFMAVADSTRPWRSFETGIVCSNALIKPKNLPHQIPENIR